MDPDIKDKERIHLSSKKVNLIMPNRGKLRNKPCKCGSGKKFKKCCYHKDHTIF